MSRDSNGNYTLPEADFVTGTVIEAGTMNSNLGDLESAITESLDRNGKGGMLARLRGVDGTSALPAYAFTSQITLGAYRASSGDYRIAFNGTDIFKFTTTENRSFNALKVSTGGCTIDAGGLTVTAGGLTVTAGGTASVGSTPAQGGTVGANTLEASGALSTTINHSHAISTLAKATTAGPNVVRLNARTENSAAVTSWDQVRIGFSYDVDNTVGTGGSFFFSKTGARLTGGTAATATDPTDALTLTNGNLKLSGTAPNKDEAIANTLTPALVMKAWGIAETDGSNGITLVDGQNIATVGLDSNALQVTIASAMASANYAPVVGCNGGGFTFDWAIASTTVFSVLLRTSSTGVPVAFGEQPAGTRITFHVMGRQ